MPSSNFLKQRKKNKLHHGRSYHALRLIAGRTYHVTNLGKFGPASPVVRIDPATGLPIDKPSAAPPWSE